MPRAGLFLKVCTLESTVIITRLMKVDFNLREYCIIYFKCYSMKLTHPFFFVSDTGFRVGGRSNINYIVIQLHYAHKFAGLSECLIDFDAIFQKEMLKVLLN